MNLESDNIVLKLKDHVKLEMTPNGSVLSINSNRWSIPLGIMLDDKVLESSRILRAIDSDQLSREIFRKTVKGFIEEDLISIALGTGLKIISIKWDVLEDFQKAPSPAQENIKLSSSAVLRAKGKELELFNAQSETIVSIDQALFFEAMAGTNLELIRQLLALGFITNRQEDPSELSAAFHLANSRDLEPIRNSNIKVKLPWSGAASFNEYSDSEFVRTLRNRRSVLNDDNGEKVTLEEVKNLLALTYGAHTDSTGETTFFYASPGKAYSVTLRVLFPTALGVEHYKYNPMKKSLDLIEKSASAPGNQNWTRIICVGDSTELNKRYNVIPYRLMLLETGVILHQLSLAAAFLDLRGKIIGYTNEKTLKNVFKNSFLKSEQILGEYVVVRKK